MVATDGLVKDMAQLLGSAMFPAHAPLVFVPGLLSDRAAWAGVIDRLGAGRDISVADVTTQPTITTMAEDVLARHGGVLVVAGHSMGGRVALEMARIAPERIAGFALFDTGFHPSGDAERPRRRELVELAWRDGMRALAARWLPPMVHPDRLAETGLMAGLTAMVERMTPAIHERQIGALLSRPDARPGLSAIRCPVLVGVGRQDAWSPPDQHRELAALIPGARLAIIEEAGHFAPAERPDAVAEAMRAAGIGSPA